MSMSKPLDVGAINANRRAFKQQRAAHTVGVVSPDGQIHECFCPPPDDGADEGPKTGDTILRWVNGEPQVPKKYKDLGYILYVDLAAQDGEPEVADRWKTAIAQRIMGTPLRGDISGLYSASVKQRRAESAVGSGTSGGKAFNVDTGEVVDDPDAQRERLAKLLTSAGVKPPEEVKTPKKPRAAKAAE